MSLSYHNLPVYVGAADASTVTENTAYVPATQVNVNYNTTSAPRRNLGVDVATGDQFTFSSALAATISMTCILQKQFEVGFEFFSDDANDNFFPIKIGDNMFQKCYATDVAITVAPDVPVTLQANFISLDPATGETIQGDATPYTGGPIPFDADQLVYGQFCTVENMGNVVGNVQSQINFKRTYNRSPIYTLGSVNASSALLDGIDEEMSIASTGLSNLINFSGDVLNSDVKVNLLSQDGATLDDMESISMKKGARVLTETYNAAGGNTVETTATLRQITL